MSKVERKLNKWLINFVIGGGITRLVRKKKKTRWQKFKDFWRNGIKEMFRK